MVAGSQVEGMYDWFQGTVAQSEVPMGPPLSKRKQVATVTISSLTAQGFEAITPKSEGGTSVSKEEIPAEMVPLRINVGNTKWVYHCHVEGYPERPSNSQAAICSHMCKAHLGNKISCPSYTQTFFNTDTLHHHGKRTHHFGSSSPVLVRVCWLYYFTFLSHVNPISD